MCGAAPDFFAEVVGGVCYSAFVGLKCRDTYAICITIEYFYNSAVSFGEFNMLFSIAKTQGVALDDCLVEIVDVVNERHSIVETDCSVLFTIWQIGMVGYNLSIVIVTDHLLNATVLMVIVEGTGDGVVATECLRTNNRFFSVKVGDEKSVSFAICIIAMKDEVSRRRIALDGAIQLIILEISFVFNLSVGIVSFRCSLNLPVDVNSLGGT